MKNKNEELNDEEIKKQLKKQLEELYGKGNVELEEDIIDFNKEFKVYKRKRRLINFFIYTLGFATATIIFFITKFLGA